MKRPAMAAACVALMMGHALAFMQPQQATPSSDCEHLSADRAQVHSAAKANGFEEVDFDGDEARTFIHAQGVTDKLSVAHLSILVDQQNGAAVALLNDGYGCAFDSVVVLDPLQRPPIDTAISILRQKH